MKQANQEQKPGISKKRWVLRKLYKLCPIVLFLVGLGVSYFLVSKDLDKFALTAVVAVTLLFAFFTYLQADAGRKMAKEVRKSRFASLQPIIVVGRNATSGEMRDRRQISEQDTIDDRTWLFNVGPGPALNLRFFLKEPDRRKPTLVLEGSPLSVLAPGEEYELLLVTMRDWKRKSRHDLVVEYEDVFGRRWCSGLELDYAPQVDKFAVLKVFYERLEQKKNNLPKGSQKVNLTVNR
jgi:hypothetical protein